jgi:hypothetical protein
MAWETRKLARSTDSDVRSEHNGGRS